MIHFDQLLNTLGYDESPFFYRLKDTPPNIHTAHLFRVAEEIGVQGIYVFETCSASQKNILPKRPAVYIAEAQNEEQAKTIHKSLWNLNFAPFLIIRMPHQIRIYTGFNYAKEVSPKNGLLHEVESQDIEVLENFAAESIDSGRIWKTYDKALNPENRVDKRLLKSLEDLKQVLTKSGLRDEIAHALIGKYVYLSYLRGRRILTEKWLEQQQIRFDDVFTENATLPSLRKLVEILEDRINGRVFPIDFEREKQLQDKHISWVASVFQGHRLLRRPSGMPDVIFQLHFPFEAYDFRYIPVETLSAIYEQFIHEKKEKGAIYTPEVLADYLLSEVESAKKLMPKMKVFDPACGSGIFLVLAYRRLIEKRLENEGKEKHAPEILADLLKESIYGVERERDACYVAAFSLILTLFHYAEPSELEKLNFKLPDLYNSNIFENDFFDVKGKHAKVNFWQKRLKFDWIVGNPPWISSAASKRDECADSWIKDNKKYFPVGNYSVAEAFSWLTTKVIKPNGVIGLVMPARSLSSGKSTKYRQCFFAENKVFRITNFANLRDVIFDGRTTYPAATFIYKPLKDNEGQSEILHYGPFSINQVSASKKKPWVITIYENEIQTVSPVEAQKGEMSSWKFALWGSYLDKRTIERIRYQFPMTLKEFCRKKGWAFRGDVQLRNFEEEFDKTLKLGRTIEQAQKELEEKLKHVPSLKDKKVFQADPIRQSFIRYSIPKGVLKTITEQECYIRKRGGESGFEVMIHPHLILSPIWMSYVIYSDDDFLMAPKHIGIKSSEKDSDQLRALSVYLDSSLVAYCLFLMPHEWGVFRQANWVSPTEVGYIPMPEFTSEQIEILFHLQKELAKTEKTEIVKQISNLLGNRLDFENRTLLKTLEIMLNLLELSVDEKGNLFFVTSDESTKIYLSKDEKRSLEQFVFSELRPRLQKKIDDTIFELFKIPDDIRLIVEDFIEIRLPLDKSSIPESVRKSPTKQQLLAYAVVLRDELDDFVMGEAHHRIKITKAKELIVCTLEITNEKKSFPITEQNIEVADLTMAEFLADVSDILREKVSQWVYIQRGLRLYDEDGPRIYICKTPRLIDWTRTQAMQDAAEIIGQIAEVTWNRDENRSTRPQTV